MPEVLEWKYEHPGRYITGLDHIAWGYETSPAQWLDGVRQPYTVQSARWKWLLDIKVARANRRYARAVRRANRV